MTNKNKLAKSNQLRGMGLARAAMVAVFLLTTNAGTTWTPVFDSQSSYSIAE